MEGTIGEIRMFGGNFAPKNWMFCNGQVLKAEDNSHLFNIIKGKYKGGDGVNTFALPNLQSRSCVQVGNNFLTASNYALGDAGGNEKITLAIENMPVHDHTLKIDFKTEGLHQAVQEIHNGAGDTDSPAGAYPAITDENLYYKPHKDDSLEEQAFTLGTSIQGMKSKTTGKSEPFYTRFAFLVVNYIICVEGAYPTRN